MVSKHIDAASNALATASAAQVGTLPAAHYLAVAQVHATLALVEQERIRNLIALQTPGGSMPTHGSYSAAEVLDNEWAEEIRQGLGL